MRPPPTMGQSTTTHATARPGATRPHRPQNQSSTPIMAEVVSASSQSPIVAVAPGQSSFASHPAAPRNHVPSSVSPAASVWSTALSLPTESPLAAFQTHEQELRSGGHAAVIEDPVGPGDITILAQRCGHFFPNFNESLTFKPEDTVRRYAAAAMLTCS